MDELLALMDEDHGPEEKETSQADSGMDELADLLEGNNHNLSASESPSVARRTSAENNYTRSTVSASSSSTSSHPLTVAKPADVGVDEKLGIRMIQRLFSSVDLLDLISTYPYHSPAQLSAMSAANLAGLLIDPPSIVDPATVTGKTNMCTVGIVMENSGTKSSAKGGAFCILKIGTFQSGPCVAVMLFGAAYSQYCRSCQPGQVVAVVNPKLLPARNDQRSDTSVSFTVYQPNQIIHVAKARDYAVCKATVKACQPDGTWKNDAARCKHYVDLRQGEYCKLHHKQSLLAKAGQSGAKGTNTKVEKLNMVQQHKFQQQQLRFPMPTVPGQGVMVTPTLERSLPHNPNAVGASRFPDSIPRHMKRERVPSTRQVTPTAKPLSTSKANPYNRLLQPNNRNPAVPPPAKKRALGIVGTSNGSTATTSTTSRSNVSRATGDWMSEALTSKSLRTKTSLAAFAKRGPKGSSGTTTSLDGTVVVPKPHHLFASSTQAMGGSNTQSVVGQHLLQGPQEDKIRAQQSALAEQRRLQSSQPNNKAAASKQAAKKADTGNAFLDSIQVGDIATVLQAKSRFASEARAEEYAQSRQKIVELEQLETKETKRAKATAPKTTRLAKEWVCKTCPGAPRFTQFPQMCSRKGHEVKTIRSLQGMTSKEEERTKLHRASADKGGLVLGRGLDWSQYRYNRFS